MKALLLRITLYLTVSIPLTSNAQSFSDEDISRLMRTFALGAYTELQQIKFELLASENGFKMLQGAADHSHTKIFITFGRKTGSESINVLESIARLTGFSSLDDWARIHDQIFGVANAALHTGWGLHSNDPRYNDPDFPDTLAFLKDTSVSWAERVLAKKEFTMWCNKVCVNSDTQEADKQVLAPRYLEVVQALIPRGS